jgi:spermidine synthase
MIRTLEMIRRLAKTDRATGRAIYGALASPFAMHRLDEMRLRMRVELAFLLDIADLCADALAAFEPDVPWERRFLAQRYTCYSVVDHALAGVARADLDRFDGRSPPALDRGLTPEPGFAK